jgi:hypothetical protein
MTILKRKKSKDRSEPDLAQEIAVRALEIGDELRENNTEIGFSNSNMEDSQENQRARSRSRERPMRTDNLDNYIQNINREDPAMAAMASDPLGKIFLNSSQHKDRQYVNSTLENFQEYKQQQTNLIREEMLANFAQLFRDQAKQEKLDKIHNARILNSDFIQPPLDFNSQDQLNDITRNQLATQLFPRTKFTGVGYPSIFEHLDNLNKAQRALKLSMDEFCSKLQTSVTGKVYEEVYSQINGNMTLRELYEMLQIKYDKRKTPQRAKEELDNYSPPYAATLAIVKTEILDLGQRAKLVFNTVIREDEYNNITTTVLLKSLPASFRKDGTKIKAELTSQEGRHPTYNELIFALEAYADVIDYGFKNDRKTLKMEASTRNFPPPFKRHIGHKKAIVRELNTNKNFPMSKDSGKNFYTKPTTSNQPNQPRYNMINNKPAVYHPSFNQNNNYRKFNNYYSQGQNKSQDRPARYDSNYNRPRENYMGANNRANHYNNNRAPNPNNMQIGGRGKLYCEMCGKNNHTADRGCYEMLTDNIKLKYLTPAQVPCDICEKKINTQLLHPPKYCPRRPLIEGLKRDGKFIPPSAEEKRQFDAYINRRSKVPL